MKYLEENGVSVSICEKCDRVFLYSPWEAREHESRCSGGKKPQAYNVYAWLDADRGIDFSIQTTNEEPTPSDRIQAVIRSYNDKHHLIYDDDNGDHFASDVASCPVKFEDIPNAIAEVQKLFLEELMGLAKRLSEMPDEIEKTTNLIKRLQ